MGTAIVIASGKGGTGKTLFTANIGSLLAMQGKKVALIDMDMGLRNLDLYMGLENRVVYNVMDVLSGMCRIKQALIKDKKFDQLYLMAASPVKDGADITPLHMEILCEKLKKQFDYILIDSPAGIGDGFTVAASAADKAVIISEAETASVRDADMVDQALEKIGIKERYCVFNKIRGEMISMGVMPGISTLARGLKVPLVGAILYDDNIFLSANKGTPIVMKPGTYIQKNFLNILNRII